MKRILSWLFGLPVAIILIAFAIANRQFIDVSFDPLSADSPLLVVPMPIWALVFGGIFIGLIAGGIAAWLRQGKWRKTARQVRNELESVRVENDRLKHQLERSDFLLAGKDEDAAA